MVTRSLSEQNDLIMSFSYLGFNGPIKLRDPEQTFCIFEDCDGGVSSPKKIFFGRFVSGSSRGILDTYTLKKRKYLSTTSMDSELALVTANLAHAAPGKLFHDPFVGTGSFLVACAHFGAHTMGSDIDGRAVRGKNGGNIFTNFQQYNLVSGYLDTFVADLTHAPLRRSRFLDGIICDPPYGVREGLKVLGSRDGGSKEIRYIDGEPAHLQDHYLPPKKPYGLEAMLDDILAFAAETLVEGGRLSLWMPTANDEGMGDLEIPRHTCLEMISVCVQAFNKCNVAPLLCFLILIGGIFMMLISARRRIRVETSPYLSKAVRRRHQGRGASADSAKSQQRSGWHHSQRAECF